MPGSEVFWRLLGQRSRHLSPEPVVPVVDFLRSRGVGAGILPGAINPQAYRSHIHVQVDPPVAGFTALTSIFTWPHNQVSGILTNGDAGGLVPVTSFLPGIYRILLQYIQGGAAPATYGLFILQRDVASIQANVLSPLPSRAEAYVPMMQAGVLNVLHWHYLEFVAEEPWKATLGTVTAVADNDLLNVNIDIECMSPLDMPLGT